MSEGGDGARLSALVRGEVQGVGFRWWVREQAAELGLSGSAANRADGRVEVVVEGTQSACDTLLDRLHGSQSPGRVIDVEQTWSEPCGERQGFRTC